jgi:VWFA-related protein
MDNKLRSSWPGTRRSRLVHLLIIFVSLFFPFQPGAWNIDLAQEKIQQPTLQYEVSVTLKLVQVFVTDKQGRPVKDLDKADFEIFDNGRPKTITDFERHFLAVPGKKPELKEVTELQKTAIPPPARLVKLNRKFFFIFDVQQNDLQGFARSKQAAFHFIDTQVQPTDEVGILSFQARIGLKMHEYLSTDQKKVRKAIEKMKGVPGTGSGGLPTEPLEEGGEGILAFLAPPHNPEEGYAEMLRKNYVSVMTELAKTLRYIPGYKNIVFFSAGFARSTLVGDMVFQKGYEDMSKEFGSSSSPVYTVNTMGSRSHFISPDDRGDLSLQNLAALSGGQYYEDVAQAEKIASGIQNATGNYYVLGYYIDAKWDGQFHEIKVKVKREDCVVSAQSGYYNPKPFSQFSKFEKELHLMDLAFSEIAQYQTPVELALIVLPCRVESGTHLVFMAELPWERLEEIMKPPMEVVSVVIDQENNMIVSRGGDIEIPDISKKRVVYYGMIPQNPGAYDCVMILRNMQTGKAARARGAATVFQPVTSGLQLDPPLLLVPTADKDVAYFRLTKQDKEPIDKSASVLKDLFPFLSNRLAPVMGEIPKGTSEVLAMVRSMIFNIPNANVEFSAHLKPDAGGKEIPLSPSIINGKRQGKVDILLLELPIPGLEPGDYTLTLIAQDKKSGAKTEVGRRIKII